MEALQKAAAKVGFDLGATEIRGFARRVVGVGAMRGVSIPLSLICSVLLARALGPQGLGIFAATMALARILAVVLGAGVPNAVVRLLSAYRARNEYDLAAGCVVWAYIHALAIPLLAGAAFACVLMTTTWLDHPQAKLIGVGCLGLLVLVMIQRGILQGFEKVVVAQLPEFLLAPGCLALLLLGFYLLYGNGSTTPELALTLQLMAFAVAAVFSAVHVHRSFRPLHAAHKARLLPRSWYTISVAMTASLISFVVMAQSSVFLLEQLRTSEEAGFFNVASVLSMLVSLPLFIVNSPVQPALARLFAKGRDQEVRGLVTSSARVAAVMAIPVAGALLLGGHLLIELLYGPGFAPSQPLLLILAAAQLANVAAGSVGVILNMTGHERDVAVTSIVVTGLQLVVSVAVIPHYGAMGAAIVQATALACYNAVLVWRVVHRHGIDPTFLGAHAR